MSWSSVITFNDPPVVPGQLVKLNPAYLDYIRDGSSQIISLGLFETQWLLNGDSRTKFVCAVGRDDICTLLAKIDTECVSMILTPERKFGWIRSSALCSV